MAENNEKVTYSWFRVLEKMVEIDEYENLYRLNPDQGDGIEMLYMYYRFCSYVLNTEGAAVTIENDIVRPMTEQEIAKMFFKERFPVSSVVLALKQLTKYNLLCNRATDGAYVVNGMFDKYAPLHIRGKELKNWEFPVGAGKQTENALYKEKRREIAKKKNESTPLMIEYDGETIQYISLSDMAKNAHVSKEAIRKKIVSLGYSQKYINIPGTQKKGLPKNYADNIIAIFKGEISENEVRIITNEVDGLVDCLVDGLVDGSTVNFEGETVNRQPKKAHEIRQVDGLPIFHANGNNNIINTDIDDDITHTHAYTRINKVAVLNELYALGFDGKPSKAELAQLKKLQKVVQYPVLLEALKRTKQYGGESIAYTQKIIDQIIEADLEIEDFDPNRDISKLMRMIETEMNGWDNRSIEELKGAFASAAKYWTDSELINTLAELSAYQDFSLTRFHDVLRTQSWNEGV